MPVDAAIDISKRPEAPVAAGPRATEPAKVAKAEPVKTVPLPASKGRDRDRAGRTRHQAGDARFRARAQAGAAQAGEVAKKPSRPSLRGQAGAGEAGRAAPSRPPAAGGPAVQLGAFGSEAKAQAAWSDLSGRFPALRSLSHSVSLAEVERQEALSPARRAGSAARRRRCASALTSAKEACNVVG